MNNNAIVLDLESQKSFDEVGGHHNRHKLGVSFVGIYSYKQDQYFGFWEKDLPALEKIMMEDKPLLIGFNTIGFDNPVLQPYFKNFKIDSLPQLDILAEIEKEIGFRIKLDSVGQSTLGFGKSGSGLDAINYYRTKQFEKLANYCIDDVKVTRYVYEYGLNQGHLWYSTGGNLTPIPSSWKQESTVGEIIDQAFKKHHRIKIRYYTVDDNGSRQITDQEVDILEKDAKRLKAFCHKTSNKKDFIIKNILTAENTQQVYAHQSSLI